MPGEGEGVLSTCDKKPFLFDRSKQCVTKGNGVLDGVSSRGQSCAFRPCGTGLSCCSAITMKKCRFPLYGKKYLQIEYKFIKSHEVPVRGQENDRVKRRESYVKDFKEIKIGKINLTKGKGELALQALEIPGNESIEFRLLMLEKVQ